jgi:hypothetical protein
MSEDEKTAEAKPVEPVKTIEPAATTKTESRPESVRS